MSRTCKRYESSQDVFSNVQEMIAKNQRTKLCGYATIWRMGSGKGTSSLYRQFQWWRRQWMDTAFVPVLLEVTSSYPDTRNFNLNIIMQISRTNQASTHQRRTQIADHKIQKSKKHEALCRRCCCILRCPDWVCECLRCSFGRKWYICRSKFSFHPKHIDRRRWPSRPHSQ